MASEKVKGIERAIWAKEWFSTTTTSSLVTRAALPTGRSVVVGFVADELDEADEADEADDVAALDTVVGRATSAAEQPARTSVANAAASERASMCSSLRGVRFVSGGCGNQTRALWAFQPL
ncbi:MAG: hypothetical protein ABIQ13_12790 [Pedococcus sp.]